MCIPGNGHFDKKLPSGCRDNYIMWSALSKANMDNFFSFSLSVGLYIIVVICFGSQKTCSNINLVAWTFFCKILFSGQKSSNKQQKRVQFTKDDSQNSSSQDEDDVTLQYVNDSSNSTDDVTRSDKLPVSASMSKLLVIIRYFYVASRQFDGFNCFLL